MAGPGVADGMADESAVPDTGDLAELESQRQLLLAEIFGLRRMREELAEEILAAEGRHAQVAERTMEAREKRQILAGDEGWSG